MPRSAAAQRHRPHRADWVEPAAGFASPEAATRRGAHPYRASRSRDRVHPARRGLRLDQRARTLDPGFCLVTITNDTRARVKRIGEPIALFFGRLGLTPNGLTLIGFGISIVAGAAAGAQLWLAAGIIGFVGGAFDAFDGTLARATGQVSKVGAFMDSVFDRWGEMVVYVGIIVGCSLAGFQPGVGLAAIAMGSAFLVSYARAKSEGLGFT